MNGWEAEVGGERTEKLTRESTTILKLLSSEDKTLLVRGDSFLVLNLGLHVLDGVGRLHLEGDGFAREGLYEDLHGGFLLCSLCGCFV